MITNEELSLTRDALKYALAKGASQVRLTLAKSKEDLVATLNGEVDRVTSCLDRSLSIALFVDGRFGSFSTNKITEDGLKDFIDKAIGMTRMLAPDQFRKLPALERCCSEAVTGNELGLVDPEYTNVSPEDRKRTALGASVYGKEGSEDCRIVSEEGEYSDSIYDTIILDSNGLECRHTENSFDYGVEVTVEHEGEKYSGYWWESSSRAGQLDLSSCGRKAFEKAVAQIDSDAMDSGKYNMVIDSEVASKVVSPLLAALSAYSIQQNNSFLIDSLGKRMFPEGLTIMDRPHIKGQTCSKLFDSEGVRTQEGPIIEKGVVKTYFVNTYMSGKLGMEATVEEATRPCVLPWPVAGLDRDAILGKCSEGILVTDFNGGNCNSATGDFSYGVEGFYFKDGKIRQPVSGMVVTGNFLRLWSGLIAAGDDARPCMSKLIPTLAFADVDFSG